MRDLFHNLDAETALPPQALSAGAVGAAIDLRRASGCVFVISTGAGDGAGVVVQEGDNGADWATVPGHLLMADFAGDLAPNAVYRIGYAGYRRYARLAFTVDPDEALHVAAIAALRPMDRPVT